MKYKLEEIVDLKIGRTPPRKEFHWFNENGVGYKWVSIKDMGLAGRYISDTTEYLTKDAQTNFGIPIVEEGTILLSFKLTIGRLCITTDKMLTNEAIAQLPIKDETIVNRDYLYYYLKNYNFSQLGSTSSIATAINSSYLKKMTVDLPAIDRQKRIATILSSIDDKIELNNRINNNLTA
ncbi:MAG: restriction endonuclease subunit S [Clostridia bacterium]|nr:restriction endonuclease subunit S [Clostridia bacterium]